MTTAVDVECRVTDVNCLPVFYHDIISILFSLATLRSFWYLGKSSFAKPLQEAYRVMQTTSLLFEELQ